MNNSNSFDETKYFLGSLCKREHRWNEGSYSLKYLKSSACVECYRWRRKNDESYRQAIVESARRYRETEKGKKYEETYRKSEARKQTLKNWNASPKKKLVSAKYIHSEKGKAKGRELASKRRARKLLNHSPGCDGKQREMRFEEFDGCCAYCGAREKLMADHFIPVSTGGADCLGNIVPACRLCNQRKSAHDAYEWYSQQPFFSKKRWQKILRVLGKTEATLNQLPLF